MFIKRSWLFRGTDPFVFAAALVAAPNVARATPHPLPFTYPYETLGTGEAELEMYTDATPLRVLADPSDPNAGRLWEPAWVLTTEIEYGINPRWEAAFYQVFEATPAAGGSNTLTFDGLKWRARTRLAEAGEWPVDVGLYFELETLHDEVSLEEKVILVRRFGNLRAMVNLWVEEELERPFEDAGHKGDFAPVVHPTAGLAYQVTPMLHLGAEYWSRGRIGGGGDGDRERRPTHFFGPAVSVNFGKIWLTVAPYVNLSDVTKPQPGEAYGPWWVRTAVGIEL
jgi:hypothetical protein